MNILVIDDHPITVDAYINLINAATENQQNNFFKANDCFQAYQTINRAKKLNTPLHVALIDLNIPEYKDENLFSGADIAILLRNAFPDCIIIILTMHNEGLILNNVVKKTNPEGFIAKNDIDFESFPEIYIDILQHKNYYSPSISNALNALIKKNRNWDDFDTQILLLLDKGIPTKDLPNHINLSLSAIEKRKALLKKEILFGKGSNKELLEKCKSLKLI
jgi:DNA-binding NarL/FixJ family response regulator